MTSDACDSACDVDMDTDERGCDIDDEAAPVHSACIDDFDNMMDRRIQRTRSGRRTRPAMERLHVRQCDNHGRGAQHRAEASAGGSAPAHAEVAQGMQGGGETGGKRRRIGKWTDATLQ